MKNPIRRGALLLVMAALSVGCGDNASGAATPAAAPAVPIETVVVEPQPLNQELVAVGSLRSDEAVVLSSEIAGRITRINFDEGQRVQRGQVLFELDDAIYRAEFDQAQANARLAHRNHERAVELFARHLIAQSDRDNAAANLEVSNAALALARARLAKTRIAAPFDGLAGLRRVSPGDYVAVGQELVGVEAVTRVKVDFRLPEAALSQLRVGQKLRIEIDAFTGKAFEGELYAIEPRVADDTRSIGLRARLDNPDAQLRPGLFARVRLQTREPVPALLIPEQAIFPRGSQQFVYVIDGGKALQREISLGQRLPGRAEVTQGLEAGTRIAITGLQRLSNGVAVSFDAADKPAPGG
ncbi:MAG TPA: efflux RND transporter periplasmic adaptor subunit [Solimonas sp.]